MSLAPVPQHEDTITPSSPTASTNNGLENPISSPHVSGRVVSQADTTMVSGLPNNRNTATTIHLPSEHNSLLPQANIDMHQPEHPHVADSTETPCTPTIGNRPSTPAMPSLSHSIPTPELMVENATPLASQPPTIHPSPTPTDSLVSISLPESDRRSSFSAFGSDSPRDSTPHEVLDDVLRRASMLDSPALSVCSPDISVIDAADVYESEEAAGDGLVTGRNTMTQETVSVRERSDSVGSDHSEPIAWDSLDRSEMNQDAEDAVC